MQLKHFTPDEFPRCTPPCRIDQVRPSSLRRLDQARDIAGIPFRVNCAYRSVEWDKSKGRPGDSAHTRGKAFDIACTKTNDRFAIINSALQAGFTRIGIYPTFIHLDDDETLPPKVLWTKFVTNSQRNTLYNGM